MNMFFRPIAFIVTAALSCSSFATNLRSDQPQTDTPPPKGEPADAPKAKPRPVAPDGLATTARLASFYVQGTGKFEGKDVKSGGPGFLVSADGTGVVAIDALLGSTSAKARFAGVKNAFDLQLLAVVPDEGLALVKMDLSGIAKKDMPQPVTIATEPPNAPAEVWCVAPSPAGGAATTLGATATAVRSLREYPARVAEEADFSMTTTWFETDLHIAQLSGYLPVFDRAGRVVGLALSAPRTAQRGSLVRTTEALLDMISKAPKQPIAWSTLSSEATIEGTPSSLKPAFIRQRATVKPGAALQTALTTLKKDYCCSKCHGRGQVAVQVMVTPPRQKFGANGILLGLEPAVFRTDYPICDLCDGRKYDETDDLYRVVSTVLWSQRKLPVEDDDRKKHMERSTSIFDQVASWDLLGLSRTVTNRSIALISGKPDGGETVMLVGFLTSIKDADGKRVCDISVDTNYDLALDQVTTMRVQVEAPETFTATLNEPVFVASLLERKAVEGGITVGYLRGGGIHAARKDLREKR
ncbi:MAG: hypothetical protein HEQ23_13815 [Tepidisphaera sp.]